MTKFERLGSLGYSSLPYPFYEEFGLHSLQELRVELVAQQILGDMAEYGRLAYLCGLYGIPYDLFREPLFRGIGIDGTEIETNNVYELDQESEIGIRFIDGRRENWFLFN
jgi:hypothetical protein